MMNKIFIKCLIAECIGDWLTAGKAVKPIALAKVSLTELLSSLNLSCNTSEQGPPSTLLMVLILHQQVMAVAKVIASEFPDRTLSGIGGVNTGHDAAEFILLGADTVQVRVNVTGPVLGAQGLICLCWAALLHDRKSVATMACYGFARCARA